MEIKIIQTNLTDSSIEVNSAYLVSYADTTSNVLNVIFSDFGDTQILNTSDLSCGNCKYKADNETINDIFVNTNPMSNFNISIKYPYNGNNGKLNDWYVCHTCRTLK